MSEIHTQIRDRLRVCRLICLTDLSLSTAGCPKLIYSIRFWSNQQRWQMITLYWVQKPERQIYMYQWHVHTLSEMHIKHTYKIYLLIHLVKRQQPLISFSFAELQKMYACIFHLFTGSVWSSKLSYCHGVHVYWYVKKRTNLHLYQM